MVRQSLAEIGAKALQLLPPEAAHDLGMQLLALDPLRFFAEDSPPFAVLERQGLGCKASLPGIGELPHPIGLAAGFDKNAVALKALARIGFSHIEIGAVTPRPQKGNPKPRLFRYRENLALVNRMGFNNDGVKKISDRLRFHGSFVANDSCAPCAIGVNIGKNKDTPPDGAIDDFMEVHAAFKDLARFFVINLSSPNTPGLRELATPEFIAELARRFGPEIQKIWIKFDPDMNRDSFQKLVEATGAGGFGGLVLTNTQRVNKPESGGLSGQLLFGRANTVLEWAWDVHRGKIPMIGVGGIMSGGDILDKIMRGANAVQIYTALAFQGPLVVANLMAGLGVEMRRRGFSSLEGARGAYY